jgi:hypothetical protein
MMTVVAFTMAMVAFMFRHLATSSHERFCTGLVGLDDVPGEVELSCD